MSGGVIALPDGADWGQLPEALRASLDVIIVGGETVKSRFSEPGERAIVTVQLGEESNLVAHARRELEAIGQFEEDEAFAESVLAAVRGFTSYPGHSGGSAEAARAMIDRLLQFKNLGPLTSNPEEWFQHSAEVSGSMAKDGQGVWQNVRSGDCFSNDGGKTYYSVDDPERKMRESVSHEPRCSVCGALDSQDREPGACARHDRLQEMR